MKNTTSRIVVVQKTLEVGWFSTNKTRKYLSGYRETFFLIKP